MKHFYYRYRKYIPAPLVVIVIVLLSCSGLVYAALSENISVSYTPGSTTPESPSVEISFTDGDTTVELFGDVSDLGESVVTKRGFVWSLTSHETPGNISPEDTDYEFYWVEEGEFGSEQFSYLPQDLQVNTDYYGRGLIEVDGEFIYSENEVVFDPILEKDNQGLATLLEVLPYVFIGVGLLGAVASVGAGFGLGIVISLAISMIFAISLLTPIQSTIQTVVDLIS